MKETGGERRAHKRPTGGAPRRGRERREDQVGRAARVKRGESQRERPVRGKERGSERRAAPSAASERGQRSNRAGMPAARQRAGEVRTGQSRGDQKRGGQQRSAQQGVSRQRRNPRDHVNRERVNRERAGQARAGQEREIRERRARERTSRERAPRERAGQARAGQRTSRERPAPTRRRRTLPAGSRQQRQVREKATILARLEPKHWLWIFAALAVVIGAVVTFRFAASRSQEHAEAQAAVPTAFYEPVACTPDMLRMRVTNNERGAGAPVSFSVELTNKSTTNPCYVDAGWGNLNVSITSGGHQVANTAACRAGEEHRRLLLDRGMDAVTTVTWPGGNEGAGCGSSGSLSTPGTYKAEAIFADGAASPATAVFELMTGGGAQPARPNDEAGSEASTDASPAPSTEANPAANGAEGAQGDPQGTAPAPETGNGEGAEAPAPEGDSEAAN
ncbi:hypothetical protein PWJ82_02955 [Actinotignum schaalii]|uniref:hypothetical protein n=1 Tax=Actinotignum schaalii TaxID=59505 RepID=UPI00237E82AE|nr:hypothetical protein [Actinotignum schaalii]MDE1654192.1 hypothetical protein [Actinotignum schaalii]